MCPSDVSPATEAVTPKPLDHDVRLDYVGMSSIRPRYTCYQPGCNGATLLSQPFMDDERWAKEKAVYFAFHPCSAIPDEGWRGG